MDELDRQIASFRRKSDRRRARLAKKIRRRARGEYYDTTDSDQDLEDQVLAIDASSSEETSDSERE